MTQKSDNTIKGGIYRFRYPDLGLVDVRATMPVNSFSVSISAKRYGYDWKYVGQVPGFDTVAFDQKKWRLWLKEKVADYYENKKEQ